MLPEVLLGSVLLVAAGGTWYLFREHIRTRKAAEVERAARIAQFRESLLRKIRGKKLSEFDFSDYVALCEIPRAEADRTDDDIYRALVSNVIADGVVTDNERRKLNGLARMLEIDSDRTDRIENDAKVDHYRGAVAKSLADGVL